MSVCVVLPTINEAENLRILLPRLGEVLGGFDWVAVVVDDGSTDGTQGVVEGFAQATGRAVLIERGAKLGLGSAIKTGMLACLERGAGVVVVMDADLQHPPEVVPRLVGEVLSGADVAIASRYVRGGGVVGWSLWRLIISRGATYMARALLPWARGIRDPVSGFFAVKAGRLAEVINALSDSSGYKLILELLTLAHARFGRDLRVVEVPYTFRNRVYGVSKLGFGELVNYALLVMRLSNYSVVKYVVSLLLGSLVSYAIFTWLSLMSPMLSNLVAIEFSVIVVLTTYLLLMKSELRLGYYVRYHLIKYSAVAVKLLLFTATVPIPIVLAISGVIQLLLTLRLIPVGIHVPHTL